MTRNSDGHQYDLNDLLRVMQRLRDPEGGCPWDRAQDFATIVSSTLEECYELADAIERGDLVHVAEELGDVLFQVIFYCQLGTERDEFDFAAVVDALVIKLLRRHPHVFANGEIEGRLTNDTDEAAVKASWERIKRSERADKSQHGILADVPLALPALVRAQKIQKRAASIGFDWSEVSQVIANLESELAELKEALTEADAEHIAEEFGDVLFSAVNLGRHLKIDSESGLRHATHKFEKRFSAMEDLAEGSGDSLMDASPERLEQLWSHVKSMKGNL